VDGVYPIYRADGADESNDTKWKPSIFMPKRICRLRLKITAVRQERLLDISEDDALKEGIHCLGQRKTLLTMPVYHWLPLKDYWTRGVTLADCFDMPREAFAELWNQINGKDSFYENPLVWVHEFTVEKI
jgi:hypothetical protein